jgi:hypothetical protein
MGLIGSLAGGLISGVGGLVAGSKLNKAYKQQQEIYTNRLNDVKAHRDATYYQDPTQSAENQAAVTQAQQVMDTANQRAAATSAVTGGTDESTALAKQQAASTVGNIMQQQAVRGAQQKESIWNAADSQIDAFNKYLAESKVAQGVGQAKAIQDATGTLASSASKTLPW